MWKSNVLLLFIKNYYTTDIQKTQYIYLQDNRIWKKHQPPTL